MAHAGQAGDRPAPDGYCAADEFFIYKFSREQAGLSGLAFDEGTFGVFGFVTEVGGPGSGSVEGSVCLQGPSPCTARTASQQTPLPWTTC